MVKTSTSKMSEAKEDPAAFYVLGRRRPRRNICGSIPRQCPRRCSVAPRVVGSGFNLRFHMQTRATRDCMPTNVMALYRMLQDQVQTKYRPNTREIARAWLGTIQTTSLPYASPLFLQCSPSTRNPIPVDPSSSDSTAYKALARLLWYILTPAFPPGRA